ncbi:hypothetical protein HJC23_001477 [Cyclotella cryptica]|uniref:PiggyBac transposable element-derived protein domain-containing protein n=1 Tax=Cyclotella cryptica TaxID=29204 RepID=A0ABD3NWV4_9STRA
MARAKPGGVGAKGSALMKLFHPSEPLRARFSDQFNNKGSLANCTIVRKSFGRVSHRGRETHLYHVTHDDFPGQEFAVSKHSFKVETACTNPEDIFEDERPPAAPAASLSEEDLNLNLRESRSNAEPSFQVPTGRGLSASEVAELRDQGIEVDDDNKPLPENVGADSLPSPEGTWADLRQCRRNMAGGRFEKGKWLHHPWSQVSQYSKFKLFEMTFPMSYIRDVVIPAINAHLTSETNIKEFAVWLGCVFFMSCYQGIGDHRLWWSLQPISLTEGAPY